MLLCKRKRKVRIIKVKTDFHVTNSNHCKSFKLLLSLQAIMEICQNFQYHPEYILSNINVGNERITVR